jgi:hypothetical protein
VISAIVPSCLLTFAAFSVFFMSFQARAADATPPPPQLVRRGHHLPAVPRSFQVGERLGVGVTLVLAIEVSKVTFSAMIPVCAELLWIEIFFDANYVFTVVSLLESMCACHDNAWRRAFARHASWSTTGPHRSSPPLSPATRATTHAPD